MIKDHMTGPLPTARDLHTSVLTLDTLASSTTQTSLLATSAFCESSPHMS